MNSEQDTKTHLVINNFKQEVNGKKEFSLFQYFFEIAQELLVLLDDKGYIKLINKLGAKQLEFDSVDLVDIHFTEIIDPAEIRHFSSQFDEILKNGHGNLKVSLQTKLGFSQIFNLNFKVIYDDESNKIKYLLISGLNIDLVKRYEKEILELYPKLHELERIVQIENQRSYLPKLFLLELNKLRTSFISNISHELRTPLASIIGFAETINSDPNIPPEMLIEFSNIILTEGKRLARLINNVLDLSSLYQGKLLLNKTKFDLNQEIKKLLNEFLHSAKEKNVTINFESNKDEIEIEADQQRLNRIIASIIHNGIKFCESYGRVFIQTKEFFKEVDILVIDTGIGINPDEIPNIFKKFDDEKLILNEANISGFSLLYAQKVIELHGGIIDIQSELNKGTTVLIKLPKQTF